MMFLHNICASSLKMTIFNFPSNKEVVGIYLLWMLIQINTEY